MGVVAIGDVAGHMEDESLVSGFVARRSDAFAQVCEAYLVELCSVALHVLRDRARAEDCVHEALQKIWRSPGAYRPERGSLRAFLIAYVRNDALEELRGPANRAARNAYLHGLEPSGDEGRPVNAFEAGRVRDAIARLPQDERDAVFLAYYEKRSHAQIAEATRSSLDDVRSRIEAAVAKLAGELSGAYPL